LSTEHKGNGFRNAVAAYESIIAIGTPATDPAPAMDPVVPDLDPVVSDPAPIEPGPVTVDDPIVTPDISSSAEDAPVPNVEPVVDPTQLLETLLSGTDAGESG
jgi:hypothetical protein